MCDASVCRICLNTDVRGYSFEQYNLRYCFEQLTRKKLNTKDALPQWVCFECATLLHKCHKFKQKCLHGESILSQLVWKGAIPSESLEAVNRQKEKLISTIQLNIKKNTRVKTYDVQHNENKPNFKLEKEKSRRKRTDSQKDLIIEIDKNKIILEIENELDKNLEDVGLVKHENLNVENILIRENQMDPIKSEMNDGLIEIDKHLSNIFSMDNSDRENTNNNTADANNIENSNYESDIDFDISNNDNIESSSDDDESLLETVKKRGKVKRNAAKTKLAPKAKKTKADDENEVQLKNTRPKKHFLNPQFWKKITLTEEEAVREFKQREFNNDYYLRAKYKCQNCFKGFSKNEMLSRHLKHWHSESCGEMECRFCHMRFRRKHQLVTHIQEHLIVHHCLRCNLQFSRLKTALFHQEHHNGIKRTCKQCGKVFNHLSTYYTHVRMSHRSSHVCVACGASFVSEHGLLQHTKFKHFDVLKQLEEEIRKRRETTDKVDSANEQPTTAIDTTTAPHTEVTETAPASDAQEIYCAKCDIKFMSRRAYNLHFFKSDNHDDGDAFAAINKDGVTGGPGSNIRAKIPTACEHCDKDFPSRQAYKKHHLAEHSHIPLYIRDERDICEICGASIQLGSISYHMKSHTGEREFACPAPACGMRFTLKANMKRHYNVKHLGMPYPKYIRRTPGRRKKKTQEILDNDFSPFVRTRTGYFL